MKMMLTAALLLAAAPAAAQDLRFCPTRPSLGSSACTTDPGHVQVEVSALDWERDDQPDQRQDTVLAGDLLARIGLTDTTEVQVGWTAYGQVRTRDRMTGAIDTERGTGDVLVAVRQNFSHPDGKGLSFGIQPFVTLPVGRSPIGAGDWGAGVVLPVTYDLTDKINVAFTGEVDAAVDEDGDGRHGAYGGILGLGYKLNEQVTVVAEVSERRDDDPADPHTETLAAGSLAWQPRDRVQLDLLATAGLNRGTPDFRLVTGGAFLF